MAQILSRFRISRNKKWTLVGPQKGLVNRTRPCTVSHDRKTVNFFQVSFRYMNVNTIGKRFSLQQIFYLSRSAVIDQIVDCLKIKQKYAPNKNVH